MRRAPLRTTRAPRSRRGDATPPRGRGVASARTPIGLWGPDGLVSEHRERRTPPIHGYPPSARFAAHSRHTISQVPQIAGRFCTSQSSCSTSPTRASTGRPPCTSGTWPPGGARRGWASSSSRTHWPSATASIASTPHATGCVSSHECHRHRGARLSTSSPGPAMTGEVFLSEASPPQSAADLLVVAGVGASPPSTDRRRARHGFVIPSWDDAEAVEYVREMPAFRRRRRGRQRGPACGLSTATASSIRASKPFSW